MTRIFDEDLKSSFATRAIHAGQRPDLLSGAIMTPIYTTSTYVQEGLGKNKGYEYARGRNPTREALERNVAALEGGTHGFAFSSGMGATDSIMKLFKSGDHIVAGESSYGGTYRLFDKILRNFGLCLFIVDNTFASPYFQRPFEHGADIVYHSTTKYLNGHSDMIGGIAVVRDDSLAERLQFIQNTGGAVPGPFDAWLVLRGTKTLHLRMPRHDENGRQIASWLAEKLGHENVIYPGLPSHPQHELAKSQMKGFGGMISVLTGSKENAARILGKVRVFSLAESLGGVESLISHPASMTHASVPAERRAALGLRDDLLRLSCGVEDVGDLIADLEQAFA